MAATTTCFLFLLIKTCSSSNINELFDKINEDSIKYNAIGANIAWQSSSDPGNPELQILSEKYQKQRILWQHRTCDHLATLFHSQLLNGTQQRQSYLLCRGPKYTFNDARKLSNLYEELRSIYTNAEVCIPNVKNISKENPEEVEEAIANYLSEIQETGINREDKTNEFKNVKNKLEENNVENVETNEVVKDSMTVVCLKGEDDFNKMMKFSRNEAVLRWLWLVWREIVGLPMKAPYNELVKVENRAARRNGYPNIGSAWRDELEIPNLRQYCRELYNSIRPLYTLLHGVVRYYLRGYYGSVVPAEGPIPAHLLSNLWTQNWDSLADLMLPKTINLDSKIKTLNWTVTHMVKRAEDYYQSLGLPPMTDKFWQKSVFTRENNTKIQCHGTAADMFQGGDFRLLFCSEISMEDFYVLHHELGHIQYYMAYEKQPALFRQANSAFHEAIGDTIMYGVLTPQHLNRLGLINDSLLYTEGKNERYNNENQDELHDRQTKVDLNQYKAYGDTYYKDEFPKIKNDPNNNKPYNAKGELLKTNTMSNNNEPYNNEVKDLPKLLNDEEVTLDMILLLKQALNKIPQIPFALLLDEYRWRYFEGGLKHPNKEFWQLALELQGIAPPSYRGEQYFDAGAKFHVPDNTPYIRYFLSSFLQHQLFEKLCSAAVFGRRSAGLIPDSISMTRCDLYGSKTVGKVLKELMSKGHSQHWSEILQSVTGEAEISSTAILNYYKPIQKVLERFVRKYQVPIDW